MTNVYDYLISRYGKENYSPNLYMLIEELESKVKVLEEKYSDSLQDIKRLEEESIETSNTICQLMENIRAVDSRIDIITEHCKINYNV